MYFFEVFDSLNTNDALGQLFREIEVERVVASKSCHQLKVYIKGKRLLTFKEIKTMEYQLWKQLFHATGNRVLLIPRYELPESYTPEKLMPIYFESILDELREQSAVDASIFKNAELAVTNEEIVLTAEDNFIVRKRAEEIKRTLEAIFNERCGFGITLRFEYTPAVETEQAEEQPLYAVDVICREAREQSGFAGGAAEVSAKVPVQAPVKTAEPKASPKREEKPAAKKEEYRRDWKKKRLPDDPDIFYGRSFDGELTPIHDIIDEIGEVVVQGKILMVEARELRNEKVLVIFNITDFTDTISGKLFLRAEQASEVLAELKKGAFVKLKGMALMDRYDRDISISSIVGIKKITDFTSKRRDNSEKKRVELHAHTLMSDMDAVVDVKTMIRRAMSWGHKALAITDHGVVQAFTDAAHTLSKGDDFKIIYGCEAYLVDDLKSIVENEKGQSLDGQFVVFDLETTGFGPVNDKIIEIGAVKVINGVITDTFSTFVNPDIPIPYKIEQLTGITDEMVLSAPQIETVLPQFLEFCKGCVLVAHNASFDVGFITNKAQQQGIETDFTVIDTVGMARSLLPDLNKFKLNVVAKELGISLENHHRAVDDAGATAEIFVKFIKRLREKEIYTLKELSVFGRYTKETIKKLPSHHAVILAKNDVGRVNLYKLISLSHLEYYQRRPKIPKSLFEENKEGLIIGSACEAGELYQAILRNESQEEITRLARFYDYLEIQPLGNNAFMIRDDKYDIADNEDLIAINKKIVALGEEFGKPVVATCDVHFLDPEDEVYRRIIMAGKGFKDADQQAPLYLRTTEEMLEEFAYLGAEKAEEVVITNTNLVADMCERISPVRPDKCAPIIKDSDKTLTDICYNKAHSMYGPNLPKIVQERLDKELHSIITNGFAVMYIIAQKLVWKSNEDGYLVGSRGSVGSSFVATMSGITEVNPLPAHYYCTHCFYSDFDSEEVKAYAGRSGCDMPDKACPVCGEALSKDGHEIPFETFLGFYGDKEPDIDLNFSGEYQNHAHDYTEIIFGKGQTYRAGTIGTLADKTAYGYVLKYNEERGIHKRRAEIERIAGGCVGVRRTTGQHPGGIIVLPIGEEIYSFTPVQRPANDMTTKTITTHFDYHSIDHNLLKLDILGHDDPTMIRMLQDLTDIDPVKEIQMDDPQVLSLFESASALHIPPDDPIGLDLGCLGVPEFGTDFVMQMLRDTKPKTFSDLVRISGLSHGTDVWLNNAQYYIANGDCTLSTAICTRDDIMTFLIHTGVENGLAFKIMESVRKGKGLTGEMETAMLAAGVPAWYIESCKKIKYMFPKAHAAAYVMMAFRIAYFKVYIPLAYYAAYFSIRASAFSYELMCQGREKLEHHMRDYEQRSNELTKKEQDTYKDMKIVQEMYARGFEFHKLDIFQAKAHHFQIIDGKLMPALSSIEGLGDKAADGVVEAAKDGPFLSQDDFRQRAKVTQTVVDNMAAMGLLGDLPISNQMSLLDFL